MFDIVKKSIQWGGRTLTLETGRIARQADGAVLATYGDTVVLCTVVASRKPKPGIDFFPLTVHYQEKFSAAGRIPGGFFKREGRATEKDTLTSRLIDRPIRPLFPEGFRNETQVICTLLSHDIENDPDIVAMVGASAALTISGIPFMGPIGGARVGFINGEYVLNPTKGEMADTKLDLVVAGTADSVMMVESEAKELTEEQMLGAVVFGHKEMQPVIDAIIYLAERAAKDPWDLSQEDATKEYKDLAKQVAWDALSEAFREPVKQTRYARRDAVKMDASETLIEKGVPEEMVGKLLEDLEYYVLRTNTLTSKKRVDGRGLEDIRPIVAEVGILPRTHGSALFTRGETQALVTATLGTSQDEQIIDAVEGEYREHFLLHYNFPGYSVGETTPMRAPGRREIGHGKLAWRAVRPLLPTKEEFPYTLRVISEITESNGSSSMATVCGTSLALMDSGVPLPRPVAGIAMGLIKEGDDFAVLSDILGDEDHLGDMDFKVAGTDAGITALQMDIKIEGITPQIMEIALKQAKGGRLHILGEMAKALTGAREEVSGNAPRITVINIPKEKIREVIGSGGKVIREICEVTGAKIDLDDDGTVKVAAVDQSQAQAAIDWIRGIVAEPELNAIYHGKVVRIVDFGAFVNLMGNKDGLLHISEMRPERVGKVTDVVNEGDMVWVKVLDIDPRGKVRLSSKVVNQETGEDISDQFPPSEKPERRERSDRGDREDRGDRGDRDRRPRRRAEG